MKVMLTGSTGFLGKKILSNLVNSGFEVVAPVRNNVENPFISVSYPIFNNIFDVADDEFIFRGVDVFIHAAALAHSKVADNVYFDEINCKLTLLLATAAAKYNVKRFLFISSIGVNGISNNSPFKNSDNPNPTELYSVSKHKAEVGLKKIAEITGMEVVFIRPPLIYGKNAPGNFGTLLRIAKQNLPLPLGAIMNHRSFVAVDNLVDLVKVCIKHPQAAGQTFLVSDDENISTSNFLKKLIVAAGNKPMLLPIPVSILKFIASFFGKKSAVEKLSNSLTVNIEHTKKVLNWSPPISLDEGIRRCFVKD